MINLETTLSSMTDLQFGNREPDFIFALRTSVLSSLQNLECNGKLSRLLAPFTCKRLPARDVLYPLLQLAHGHVWSIHMQALYKIDELEAEGKLDQFKTVPSTYEGQVKWRDALVALVPGCGMKIASFCMLIYAPMQCMLIALDRHHLRRLGMNPNRAPIGAKYIAVEMAIMSERDEMGYSHVNLGIFSAFVWAQQRDGIDAESYPSHKKLSCRWY